MEISVACCAGKYGLENRGRISFLDKGPARKDWNEVVIAAWKTDRPQWVGVYLPKAAIKWRAERKLAPLNSSEVGRIAGVVEIPPPPRPFVWNAWGFDRWPLGVPTGRQLKLHDPLDLFAQLSTAEQASFSGYMQQSRLFQLPRSLCRQIETAVAEGKFEEIVVAST